MKSVVRYLRKVANQQAREGLTDGQLLEAFLAVHDEAAFEALLRRHGPMVLGVCRRVLRNPHDAEDAFQATFLVLVRKAATIRPRALVGNWLYGVACRTARRARAMNIQRQNKERQAHDTAPSTDAFDAGRDQLLDHLDAELSRLPDKYRVPVALCELEGKSRKAAAQLLGLPEGTLSWRLARARKLLARRLARYGVALSAAGLAAELSSTASAAVSPTLLTSTAKAALQVGAGRALIAGVASAQVITLTKGVLQAMLLSKLKVIWTVALAVTIGAGVSGLTYRAMAAEPNQPGDVSQQARVASDELEALRLEIEALRRGLQATRERVKLLENEVQTWKQAGAAPVGRSEGTGNNAMMGRGGTFGTAGGAPMMGDGTSSSNPGSGTAMMGGFGRGGAPMMGGGAFGRTGNGMPTMTGTSGSSSTSNSSGEAWFGTRRATPSDDAGTQQSLGKPRGAEDPLVEAETALKELRQHPGDKPATDRLERALLRLKEQARPKGAGGH